MEFGIQFFPDVNPEEQSGADYWAEAIRLVSLCDQLGYTSVRTVEHYFQPYGGYSPSPIVFLAAAAMMTAKAKLITGAVLPAFNHPLKVAGELGMLDAITGGRLEVGFGRAFLPHEFLHFRVSLDESRARFEEGMEQVRLLLEEENVTSQGRFHSFENITSLPRPTQKPRPPFWVASVATPESFTKAGHAGYGMMAIPLTGAHMAELLGNYRESWQSAGHPGQGGGPAEPPQGAPGDLAQGLATCSVAHLGEGRALDEVEEVEEADPGDSTQIMGVPADGLAASRHPHPVTEQFHEGLPRLGVDLPVDHGTRRVCRQRPDGHCGPRVRPGLSRRKRRRISP